MHYYEDVDDEGGLTASSGPGRLAMSDQFLARPKEDPIVITTNQAYRSVDIEDVKMKLNKKKLHLKIAKKN